MLKGYYHIFKKKGPQKAYKKEPLLESSMGPTGIMGLFLAIPGYHQNLDLCIATLNYYCTHHVG